MWTNRQTYGQYGLATMGALGALYSLYYLYQNDYLKWSDNVDKKEE